MKTAYILIWALKGMLNSGSLTAGAVRVDDLTSCKKAGQALEEHAHSIDEKAKISWSCEGVK